MWKRGTTHQEKKITDQMILIIGFKTVTEIPKKYKFIQILKPKGNKNHTT